MSAPSIRWHTGAARASNAPEVLPAEWEEHRELLRKLYLGSNKTLNDVMEYMKEYYNFAPSCVQAIPSRTAIKVCRFTDASLL
jgi:hypothetical protein